MFHSNMLFTHTLITHMMDIYICIYTIIYNFIVHIFYLQYNKYFTDENMMVSRAALRKNLLGGLRYY